MGRQRLVPGSGIAAGVGATSSGARNEEPQPVRRPAGTVRDSRLFAVRYGDTRGQTVTTLYWVRGAAERFAARVEARGGYAAIYRADVGGWAR